MRLYEFKNTAKNIDVVVVTDGLGDQKRVFITETPRGISVPGEITKEENPNNQVFAMGFDFVAGTEREHLDFFLFAINSGCSLTQWNEGLGESSPIELVPENVTFTYAISCQPSSLSFSKTGGEVEFVVTSTKTVATDGDLKGMVIPVKYKAEITAGTLFSINKDKTAVIAQANAGSSAATGTMKLTQLETGSKSVNVSLSVGAA